MLEGTPFLTRRAETSPTSPTTEPPDLACVFAWKQRKSTDERMRFELVAVDLLKDLGYEV